MAGFDLAVCAAGYNTWNELMHAGVPSLFLPQDKVADDQSGRAARAAEAGAGQLLASIEELPAAVAAWREPTRRAAASTAARGLVPKNHARELAAELLRLVLPASAVASAEDAVDDDLLAAAGDDLELYLDVVEALDGETASGTSRHAVELLGRADGEGIPRLAAQKITTLLARRLPTARPDERAEAAARVLAALRPFDDWGGAQSFLKIFATDARPLPDAVCDFLAGLRARGEDLYRGIARLSNPAPGAVA